MFLVIKNRLKREEFLENVTREKFIRLILFQLIINFFNKKIFFLISKISFNFISECILPLKPDWSFFSPLIFTLNGTLISTENSDDITLRAGTEVLLSCTPNYFRDNPAEKTIRAICKEERTLRKWNGVICEILMGELVLREYGTVLRI